MPDKLAARNRWEQWIAAALCLLLGAGAYFVYTSGPLRARVETTKVEGSEYVLIGWEKLSGALLSDTANGTVPAQDGVAKAARALDGQRVAMQGWMEEAWYERGRVSRFLLVSPTWRARTRSQSSTVPFSAKVAVFAAGGGRMTELVHDRPVTVIGRLTVGEEIRNGAVWSIYCLDADKVAVEGEVAVGSRQ